MKMFAVTSCPDPTSLTTAETEAGGGITTVAVHTGPIEYPNTVQWR